MIALPTKMKASLQQVRFAFLVLVVATFATEPSEAGFLGDVWSGVKEVVSAPVKAAGWLIGQGVNEAVDPALDNTFGRLRETSDHALNRFDQISEDRVTELDNVAKARIEQIDVVMGKRLDQVDEIMDDKLLKLEEIASDILDREADILESNVSRVEGILDSSLDRIQQLETDAFDRVDAALQDQVPFAASRAAQTFEWTAAAIIFLVVFVGFGGVELLRKVFRDHEAGTLLSRLKRNLRYVPRALLLAGVPMVLVFVYSSRLLGIAK